MLEPMGPGIWIADGPRVAGMGGFDFPTRMAVLRLEDGGLLVWSPVAMSDPLKQAVTALGPVRHIVAPNSLHHLAMPDWAAAFPEAALHGAPGVAEKRPELRFDNVLGDTPPPDWDGQVDQAVFPTSITREVVLHHRASRTVLFTDLLQNMPRGWFRGWRALVARLDLMTEPEPTVPRKFRMATRDKPAARDALARIRAWEPDQVVMAHGTPLRGGGTEFLSRAFDWLA